MLTTLLAIVLPCAPSENFFDAMTATSPEPQPLTVGAPSVDAHSTAEAFEARLLARCRTAEWNEPLGEPARASAAQEERGRGGSSYLRLGAGLLTSEESDGPDEDIDFDEGFLASIAFGQRLNSGERANFALELEGIWTDQDADDQGPIVAVNDVNVGAVLLNGVLDLPLGERAAIYLGAGLGAAWVDVGTQDGTLNDFDADDGPHLCWQGRAGFEWRFATSTAFYVGYRFLNIDDIEIEDDIGTDSFDLETVQHVAEVGLKLGF